MDSIFRGSLSAPGGRRRAWLDALFIDHGALRLGWTNRATVIPGRLYRSNQPLPNRLAADARRWGLRSVLNLRGATGNGADALEREAAARLGLHFIDVALRSRVAPSRALLLELIAALREAPAPTLVHCKSGADRAGFAAAIGLLLAGVPIDRAAAQLSWRHGHIAGSRAGILGAVLAAFAGRPHQRQDFETWVRETYDPAGLRHRTRRFASLWNDRVLGRE
jgi:protein tyrosine/serine phosphatase